MTALFCAMATPTPLVITYHGSDLNPLKGSNWLRHSCARLMSQIASLRASQIICVSEQLKSRLWWPQVATRAHVLPLGIEMDIFPLITKNEARKALGWNEDAKIIVFNAGRMHQRSNKRLDLAQAAVQVAQGLVEGIQFVVLDGSVTPERIPLVMNGADCLLVTSDYEGSPTIVKEAMACNLPVVSVDVGDVRERLRNVYPSRIVVRDPELLGRAMNDVLALKCRSNGREIVECDLSERVVVQKTLDVYNRVLQSSQRTR